MPRAKELALDRTLDAFHLGSPLTVDKCVYLC